MSRHQTLHDRVIVITGASTGIGRATARACARAGMDVAVSARRLNLVEALAGEIRTLGRRAFASTCDVRHDEEVAAFVSSAHSALGRVDAVLANAGFGFEAGVADMTDAQLREIFEVNFYGTMRVIRAAVPIFRARRGGHILITSSAVGRFTLPYYAAYTATKAAQTHIGRALRVELAPECIDVSTIHPITTTTDFFEVSAARSGRKSIPLSRQVSSLFIQPPERVANAIVRCLRRPVPEVWTCHSARLLGGLLTISPRLADFLMSREAARRRQWLAEFAISDRKDASASI